MTNAPLAVSRWANREVLGPRFLEVHKADLVAPNGRRMRMVASSRDAIEMGAQVDAYIGQPWLRTCLDSGCGGVGSGCL